MNDLLKTPLSRRRVLGSAATLPLAQILATPALAQMTADSLQTVSATRSDGRTVSAALALPEQTPAMAVVLIHEWWGLNAQIKSVAAELAKLGYVALAVDLYDGQSTDDPAVAQQLVAGVTAEEGQATLQAWIKWLRDHDKVAGAVASMGWCFGGGWSLQAAVHSDVDGIIIYYGRVDLDHDELKKVKVPVLGHFATQDKFITREMVDRFEVGLAKTGNTPTIRFYEADHGFANPTTARYDEEDAAAAWRLSLEFLQQLKDSGNSE